MTEGTEILFLTLALFVAVWLIEYGDRLQTKITAVWGILSDKDRGLPVFVLGLAAWAVFCWLMGWL